MATAKKYAPATLPQSQAEAVRMAEEREQWAREARDRDQYGSAQEFELTALLLRALYHFLREQA